MNYYAVAASCSKIFTPGNNRSLLMGSGLFSGAKSAVVCHSVPQKLIISPSSFSITRIQFYSKSTAAAEPQNSPEIGKLSPDVVFMGSMEVDESHYELAATKNSKNNTYSRITGEAESWVPTSNNNAMEELNLYGKSVERRIAMKLNPFVRNAAHARLDMSRFFCPITDRMTEEGKLLVKHCDWDLDVEPKFNHLMYRIGASRVVVENFMNTFIWNRRMLRMFTKDFEKRMEMMKMFFQCLNDPRDFADICNEQLTTAFPIQFFENLMFLESKYSIKSLNDIGKVFSDECGFMAQPTETLKQKIDRSQMEHGFSDDQIRKLLLNGSSAIFADQECEMMSCLRKDCGYKADDFIVGPIRKLTCPKNATDIISFYKEHRQQWLKYAFEEQKVSADVNNRRYITPGDLAKLIAADEETFATKIGVRQNPYRADSSGEAAVDSSGEAAADSSGEAAVDSSGEAAADSSGEAAVDSSGEAAADSSGEAAADSSGEAAADSSEDAAPEGEDNEKELSSDSKVTEDQTK